jgi:hypothetical protein
MMIGEIVNDIDVHIPRDAYDTGKDMPTFNVYLTAIVRDSKGNIIKVHRQRSHSPTTNFIALILPVNYYTTTGSSITITGLGGATYNYQPAFSNGGYDIAYPNSASNYPSYLIEIDVGSGQQSNPLTATNLAAPIANGSGSGQLMYSASSISPSIIVSGSSAYFYISQTFINQSGGTVTIKEVGVVTRIQLVEPSNNGSAGNYTLLTWYDVLSSPISVPNGGSIVIYYTFTVNP